MDQTRAQEIIASYGADTLRWPLHERAALLEFIQGDAELQAAFAAAVPLDAALGDWARPRVAAGFADAAALAALAAIPATPRWWRGIAAGSAIAASVALAFAVLPPEERVVVTPTVTPIQRGSTDLPMKSEPVIRTAAVSAAQPTTPAPVSDADADAAVYAMMFTETPEEEMSL